MTYALNEQHKLVCTFLYLSLFFQFTPKTFVSTHIDLPIQDFGVRIVAHFEMITVIVVASTGEILYRSIYLVFILHIKN